MANQTVKQANELLRTELDPIWPGFNPPQGKFQLKWSNDLQSIIPVYEDKGEEKIEPVLDYYCMCGVNVNVHTPQCSTLTIAKIRMRLVSTFGPTGQHPSYNKVWVLCRWAEPPHLIEWCEAGGTEADYPANGRYVPVSKGPRMMVIPPAADEDTILVGTRLIIKMMREHITRLRELQQAERDKQRRRLMPVFDSMGREIIPADPGVPYWEIKDRLLNKMMQRDPDATVGYTKELGASKDGTST